MRTLEPTMAHAIDSVRAFNRFYTRHIGLLDEGVLNRRFTLTETRVLFELSHNKSMTASDLVRDLGLDPGYLSRIVAKFEATKLVSRTTAPNDGRRAHLKLTVEGRKAFAPLDRAARTQVDKFLAPLSARERQELLASMRAIQRLLNRSGETEPPYALRDLTSGDLGWIVHRQGLLYRQEYGWDETYEALVASILADFVKTRDA